jgi:hypothetical protein
MKSLSPLCLSLWLAAVAAVAAEPGPAKPPVAALTNFGWNLPVVLVQATQRIASELKVPCGVGIVLPGRGKTEPPEALPALIRFHGATSQGYPKKSFGLTLDASTRWLGMTRGTHWVLNAAAVDRSLMRHKLSYDLFRSLSTQGGQRFAAASRFVELKLNGRYEGVYLLMEQVDRPLLKLRRFDSNATSQACIYKAVDHTANFSQPGHDGYEQRFPDPTVRQYWGPLEELNRFTSGAADADFFAAETGVGSRLDLACAMDFHLLVLLTSNMDGIDKNFILARDAPTAVGTKPRFFFVPWDYDATFGRNWEASRVGSTEWLSSHLFDRLLSDRAYRQQFAARWRQLRAREFSVDNLGRMIDECAQMLGEAVLRNAARWESPGGSAPDRRGFDAELRQMKEWVMARTKWLDAEVARREGSPPNGR